MAPVKAPRSCPNISDSTRSRGMAAQLTVTNARADRRLAACTAAAASSLPVPLSPVRSTRASVGATRATSARTCSIAALAPTSAERRESSACSARFSARVRLSSIAARTVTSTDSGASGFSRNWKAPSFTARTASVSCALPLIMMTGVPRPRSRMLARVASPSGPGGISRSSRTTSGSTSSSCSSAALPFGASATVKPFLAQERGQHPADVGLVVDEQDLGACGHRPRIRTTNVAPPPGVGWTAIVPWCISIVCLASARPRPVPPLFPVT